jgi:hypothetical protein
MSRVVGKDKIGDAYHFMKKGCVVFVIGSLFNLDHECCLIDASKQSDRCEQLSPSTLLSRCEG